MAKAKGILADISGTLGNITFVQTRKGGWARAKRGTYKPAECNDQLKHQTNRNNIVNAPAKLVHDVLKVYAKWFKKSDLWQDLLKIVRRCRSDVFVELLQTMEGTEANPRYRFDKIVPLAFSDIACNKGVITLALYNCHELDFNLPAPPPQYFVEWHVLFIDDERKSIGTETINSGWVPTKQPLQKFETSFELPVTAKYYVAFAKVQGGEGGRIIADMRAMGVKVMKVGEC